MEQTETRPRDLPLWLGLTLICLGLIAGGWFVYWQLSGYLAGKPRLFTIPGVEPGQYAAMQQQPAQRVPGQRMPGVGVPPPPARDIYPSGSDAWRIRAGVMTLNVRKQGDTLTFQGSIPNPASFHPDYTITLLAKTRLKPEQLTALGVTDEQLKLLKQVQGSLGSYPVRLAPADIDTLTPLFVQWQAAPDAQKPAKSTAVVAAARKITNQQVAAAKAVAAAQIGAFRKTFSDETWQKLRDATISKTTAP